MEAADVPPLARTRLRTVGTTGDEAGMNGLKCPSRKATAREQDEVTKGKTCCAAGSPRQGTARTQCSRVGTSCSRGGTSAGPCLCDVAHRPPRAPKGKPQTTPDQQRLPHNTRTWLEPRRRSPRTGRRAAGRCKHRPQHAGPRSRALAWRSHVPGTAESPPGPRGHERALPEPGEA